MKTDLETRRQKLLGELAQVDRQIARTQKRLAHLETRIARASPSREKAA
jgi:septal ring factor EnvC (AmiA/AmiB activator)